MSAPEEKPRRALVYLGVFEGIRGQTLHGYAKLDPEDDGTALAGLGRQDAGENAVLYGKRFGHALVGDVLSIEYDPESGDVYPKSAERSCTVDTETATAWAAESKATQTRLDVRRSAKKRGSADQLAELLAPVNELYAKQRGRDQRAAFLARVIDAVTKGQARL